MAQVHQNVQLDSQAQNLDQERSLWSPKQQNQIENQNIDDSSEITVMAEIPIKSIGEQKTLIQKIPTTETIRDLKIRLKSRGIYGNKFNIFVGQTQLFDHQKLIDVYTKAQEKTQDIPLHIVLRFSDIERFNINTKDGGQFSGRRNFSNFSNFGQRYIEYAKDQLNGTNSSYSNGRNGSSNSTSSCRTNKSQSSKSRGSAQSSRQSSTKEKLEVLSEVNEDLSNLQMMDDNNETNNNGDFHNGTYGNGERNSYCNGDQQFIGSNKFESRAQQQKFKNKQVQQKVQQELGEKLKDNNFQNMIRLDSKMPPQVIDSQTPSFEFQKNQTYLQQQLQQKDQQQQQQQKIKTAQSSSLYQDLHQPPERSPFDRSLSTDHCTNRSSSPTRYLPTEQSLVGKSSVPELDTSQALLHIFVRQKSRNKVKLHMVDNQRYEIHVQAEETSPVNISSSSQQLQQLDSGDSEQFQFGPQTIQNPLSFYSEHELELIPFSYTENGLTSDLDPRDEEETCEKGIDIVQNGGKGTIGKRDYCEIQQALESGVQPDLIDEGTGGTYLLRNQFHKPIFVFKPIDEEPNGRGNPKYSSSFSSSTSNIPGSQQASSLPQHSSFSNSSNQDISTSNKKRGVRPGQGAFREVAAYLLDSNNFCNVPQTVLASMRGKQGGVLCKFGSLQKFVPSEGSCEQFGYSMFPIDQVHRVCILDLRLANADRNAGNILLYKQESGDYKLIPIDHGLCLPSSIEDVYYEWMDWPQSKQKFADDFKTHIKTMDAEKDIEMLQSNGIFIGEKAEFIFRVNTQLLKYAVELDCSPFQIGLIVMRYANRKAPLEKILNNAVETVTRNTKFNVVYKKFNQVPNSFFKQNSNFKSLLDTTVPILEECIKEHSDTTFDDLEEFL